MARVLHAACATTNKGLPFGLCILLMNTESSGPKSPGAEGSYIRNTGANGSNSKMIGFELPNKKGEKQLSEYVVPVNRIETITGIDFFPQLSDELEEVLESHSNYSSWAYSEASAHVYKPSQSSSTTKSFLLLRAKA